MAEPTDNTAAGAVNLGVLTGNKFLTGSGGVQSHTAATYGGRPAAIVTRDAADWYSMQIGAGITQVALRPGGITFPNAFGQAGINGAVQHLDFTPGGGFSGPKVTLEIRVGYARHAATVDGVLNTARNIIGGLASKPTDLSYYKAINNQFVRLMEVGTGDLDAAGAANVAMKLRQLANQIGSSLTYSAQLKSMALSLAAAADQWWTPSYLVNAGGENAAVTFADLTSSFVWTAAPGAVGYVGVTGYEAVSLAPTATNTLPTYQIRSMNYGLTDVSVRSQSEPGTKVGTAGNDTLVGSNGNDLLMAGAGVDVLNGAAGDDRMYGGNGSDTYYVSSTGDRVIETNAVAATGGIDRVISSVSYVLPANVENGTLAAGAANLTGNTLANVLIGNNGPNVINGGVGNDQLIGGDNKASGLTYGSGSRDHFNQNEGFPVYVGASMSLAANADIFNSTTIPHVTVNGTGHGGAQTVSFTVNNVGAVITIDVDGARGYQPPFSPPTGWDAEITLYGPNGQQVAYNDYKVLFIDNINEPDPGSFHNDDPYLSFQVTTPGTYTVKIADAVNGAIAVGRTYQMHISVAGEMGQDVLIGGAGKDRMTGGLGIDYFDFNAIAETGKTAATRDVITDFTHLVDKIDLSTIDANTRVAGDQAFVFAQLSAVPGRLYYFFENPAGTANDKTIVQGDVNGDRVADFQIELTGLKTLTAGDFIV
jgi:Ca2+-binding RTX toxin-like protein